MPLHLHKPSLKLVQTLIFFMKPFRFFTAQFFHIILLHRVHSRLSANPFSSIHINSVRCLGLAFDVQVTWQQQQCCYSLLLQYVEAIIPWHSGS